MIRQTSIDAYKEIIDSLGPRHRQVWIAFKKYGPGTANEIISKIPFNTYSQVQTNFLTRATELRDMGSLKELPSALCKITGHRAYVFEALDRKAVKTKRKKVLTMRQKLKMCLVALEHYSLDLVDGRIARKTLEKIRE
jgi:hypothetical protein